MSDTQLEEYMQAAGRLALEKAEQRRRADRAEEAHDRLYEAARGVILSFEALGNAAGPVAMLQHKANCEHSMSALKEAVGKSPGFLTLDEREREQYEQEMAEEEARREQWRHPTRDMLIDAGTDG